MGNPGESAVIVRALAQAIERGDNSLDSVPGLIARAINDRLWQYYIDSNHPEDVTDDQFPRFVAQKFPEGLNSSLDSLRRLCRGSGVELANTQLLEDFLDTLHKSAEPALSKNGRPKKGDNITVSKSRGTSPEYALRRLKRDRPDLADLVINGKMSANAAAIAAGFRKSKKDFYPEDATGTIEALTKHCDKETLRAIRDALDEYLGE